MSKVKWIIFAVVVVGILTVLIVMSSNSGLNVDKVDTNAVQTGNNQDGNIADHTFGKSGSKVTLIEYGDFQCSGCANINPSIIAITEQYKDELQFIFRNFPLTSIHSNTKIASATAEAAGLQGKYWEAHTKIYATQTSWEDLTGSDRTDFFVNLASELGLDTNKLKNDITSEAVAKKIDYDQALAYKLGLNSTPTFYLNGVKLDSTVWSDNTKLKDAINVELKKAGISIPE